MMVIILSGLQSQSMDIIEAPPLDGGGPAAVFTWLRPTDRPFRIPSTPERA
jgi:hypothetical protein